MYITEIFNSIQGEGTRAGLPCIFVRLTGCNLRCTWCDTAYAFHGGKKMSVEEVVARVDALSGRKDGEAAIQLVANGYSVMIETSGERYLGRLPKQVVKIVDVKCPDSGEPDTFEMRNLEVVTPDDEMKFVISSRKDYEFARKFVTDNKLAGRVNEILFSPVQEDPQGKWKGLEARSLVEWILQDGLKVRLGLQLHKIVWDPATKGV
jgi:7-carboxy-7-deazaguanine synthase